MSKEVAGVFIYLLAVLAVYFVDGQKGRYIARLNRIGTVDRFVWIARLVLSPLAITVAFVIMVLMVFVFAVLEGFNSLGSRITNCIDAFIG